MHTPRDLARPAVRLGPAAPSYDAAAQIRFDPDGADADTFTTYNGTQTFDGAGRPKDADNDK